MTLFLKKNSKPSLGLSTHRRLFSKKGVGPSPSRHSRSRRNATTAAPLSFGITIWDGKQMSDAFMLALTVICLGGDLLLLALLTLIIE
jgi:hypothetical protein